MPSELPDIARRQAGCDAGRAQGREEALRSDFFHGQHGRHVQRLLQGAAHGDGALVVAVEVARQPVAEAHRHILDQRIGMQRAIVEGHGVDQRFQRRARRAVGAHQIDLAGAAEEVGAAQPGHDTAGAIVEHDHGDLGLVRELAALLGRELGQHLPAARSAASSARPCPATGRPATPTDAAPASAARAGGRARGG